MAVRNSALIRPLVRSLHAYVPGEQPKIPGLIKLNTNENPYPPSPKVLAAVKAAVDGRLRLYPNPTAERLRAKLARRRQERGDKPASDRDDHQEDVFLLHWCHPSGTKNVNPAVADGRSRTVRSRGSELTRGQTRQASGRVQGPCHAHSPGPGHRDRDDDHGPKPDRWSAPFATPCGRQGSGKRR